MADVNPNLSPAVTHQPSLLGGAENMKLLFDEVMNFGLENQRAWATLNLRIANNAQTIDHAINAGLALAGLTGISENQQVVSPAGTAASEAVKGAVGVAGAGQAVNAETITSAVAKLADALVAVIVTAAGGASTPSQTKPPTA